jgi:hypothetical protein
MHHAVLEVYHLHAIFPDKKIEAVEITMNQAETMQSFNSRLTYSLNGGYMGFLAYR